MRVVVTGGMIGSNPVHGLNAIGIDDVIALFDNIVRRMLPTARFQVTGFRYFNVYGPREQHKRSMASVAFHHFGQLRETGKVKLFGEYGGCGAGQQVRDFVRLRRTVCRCRNGCETLRRLVARA